MPIWILMVMLISLIFSSSNRTLPEADSRVCDAGCAIGWWHRFAVAPVSNRWISTGSKPVPPYWHWPPAATCAPGVDADLHGDPPWRRFPFGELPGLPAL